jgi:hypothetical protein
MAPAAGVLRKELLVVRVQKYSDIQRVGVLFYVDLGTHR